MRHFVALPGPAGPALILFTYVCFVFHTHNTSTSTLIGLKITELKNDKPGTVNILQQHIFWGGFILVSLQRCSLHALTAQLTVEAGWLNKCV